IWCPVGDKRPLLKIEITAGMPHVIPRPLKDFLTQPQIIFLEVSQLNQRNEALRDGVNIDRVRSVMKISSHTLRLKEVRSIKLEAVSNAFIEDPHTGNSGNLPQRNQVVSGVKVVNPLR